MRLSLILGLALTFMMPLSAEEKKASPPKGEGWQSLFNGKDLKGWNEKEVGKHWQIVEGVIDCNAELGRGPDLITKDQYADYSLYLEWRFKGVKGAYPMKIILPDGSYKKDDTGKEITVPTPNADSGIFLRGTAKGQINLWCWPIGSGELWAVRNNKQNPPEVRAGAVPKKNADKPVGQWNTMKITLKGDRVTVVLNDETVIENAKVPDLPKQGPILLQHHGGKNQKTGKWSHASSLIQFRNVWVKRPAGQRR